MKSDLRAFLIIAATWLGVFTTGADARADPKQECADAYEKTQSFRDSGQLLEARKQAIACSASTCSVYMTKDCLQWVTEIDALLPTVLFTAEDAAGANTLAVRVVVDGKPLAEQLDATPVPLEAGEHVLRFELTGADAVELRVMIHSGEKKRTISVSFKKAPPPKHAVPRPVVPPPIKLTATGPAPASKPAPLLEPAPIGADVPLWAWASGEAAVVLMAVSAGFGVSSVQTQKRLVIACEGDPAHCPKSTERVTVPLAAERTLDRNISVGVGAFALVGVGVAVVGIATAPPKKASTPVSVLLAPYGSPSGAGLVLQGQF